eukprot:jgi/Mesvir1/27130/Mv20804-RA.1
MVGKSLSLNTSVDGRRERGWVSLATICSASATQSVESKAGKSESASYECLGEGCHSVGKTTGVNNQVTIAMKFGGSSVRDAVRMEEVAKLIMGVMAEGERPAVILSAMGSTTNMLLAAGDSEVQHGFDEKHTSNLLKDIADLHKKTCRELGVDVAIVEPLLQELTQLLTGISLMREVSARSKDYLVSFGERLATRIFAAYMNKIGVKAKQWDAWELGLVTDDEFGNARVLPESYPAIAKALRFAPDQEFALPIITGFLAKGVKKGAITTLGRGGSDLTCTVIGAALQLKEVQVWKDVDGVLTCDPRIAPNARPVNNLTFEEAAELAFSGAKVLHPESMWPCMKANTPVRVKNSYKPSAPGTLITDSRDMSEVLLTSIVAKKGVTLVDIISLRMHGQYGFLAKVFTTFEALKISVDVVATSDVSLSLTLDPARLWSREMVEQECARIQDAFRTQAKVEILQSKTIISLIGNVRRSSQILEKVFSTLRKCGVNAQMLSQGHSKVNISLVVDDDEADRCIRAMHAAFFEDEAVEMGVLNGAVAAAS